MHEVIRFILSLQLSSITRPGFVHNNIFSSATTRYVIFSSLHCFNFSCQQSSFGFWTINS
jgi:hypothetical protein